MRRFSDHLFEQHRLRTVYHSLMRFGHKTGCHQRPDRSFFYHGHQFPVCARCTGVFIGYMITVPIYIKFHFSYIACICACSVMFVDWFIQYVEIKESTNLRRLITGFFGGFGVFGLEILLLHDSILFIKSLI